MVLPHHCCFIAVSDVLGLVSDAADDVGDGRRIFENDDPAMMPKTAQTTIKSSDFDAGGDGAVMMAW